MAWSLSSINDAINSYNKKIDERKIFITNASRLISNANQSSQKLEEAAYNLALGLTIGSQSVDSGRLSDMVIAINKNVITIQSAVNLANSEIKIFGIKLANLKVEKEKIIQAVRDANREKNQENTVVRKTLKESIQ